MLDLFHYSLFSSVYLMGICYNLMLHHLQAGFFARLIGPNIAAASAQSSLKSLSGSSPSIQLAARNCFLLEDPPDDKKEPSGSERYVNLFQAYIFLSNL